MDIKHRLRTQAEKMLPNVQLKTNFGSGMKIWGRSTDEGFIFAKRDKDHYSNFPGHYKRAWERLLEDCSIAYRKIYGTRHTFIVNMIRNSGLSILDIAQTAGHSSVQMVLKHYGKYIKNEQMSIDRSLKLFTDFSTDSVS